MPEFELPIDMTGGKASYAKAAEGDKPVFEYIASLPQPQRAIAERIDALAARTLPDLRRAVKWGMAYYGVEGGWCFTRSDPGLPAVTSQGLRPLPTPSECRSPPSCGTCRGGPGFVRPVA